MDVLICKRHKVKVDGLHCPKDINCKDFCVVDSVQVIEIDDKQKTFDPTSDNFFD